MSFLVARVLRDCGVRHGFGTRDAPAPAGLVRPQQVHGATSARVVAGRAAPAEADAIACAEPGLAVGVVTADCVPILVTAAEGGAVAAIHAGWRGLAAGVVEAGVRALEALDCGPATAAAIGPHIGPCCYEVDEPVLAALARAPELAAAARPGRPGHAWLDLGRLVRAGLLQRGLAPDAVEMVGGCTRCEVDRFHSYRRDGRQAGRLVHFAAAARVRPARGAAAEQA